ncbi:MAG TPA: hypothetical protein VGA27_11710 [Candidatus Binatia bacterium]
MKRRILERFVIASLSILIFYCDEMIEQAREAGTQTRKKAVEIVDNRVAKDLTKSGFIAELWGTELPK